MRQRVGDSEQPVERLIYQTELCQQADRIAHKRLHGIAAVEARHALWMDSAQRTVAQSNIRVGHTHL